MSRQTEYQKRKIADGKCEICGHEREPNQKRRCKACAERYRQRKRKKEPWKPGSRGRPPLGREAEALASKIELMLSKLEQMEKTKQC